MNINFFGNFNGFSLRDLLWFFRLKTIFWWKTLCFLFFIFGVRVAILFNVLYWSGLLWIFYLILRPGESGIFAHLVVHSTHWPFSVLLVLVLGDRPLPTCFCLYSQNYCLHLILKCLLFSALVFKIFSYLSYSLYKKHILEHERRYQPEWTQGREKRGKKLKWTEVSKNWGTRNTEFKQDLGSKNFLKE